MKKLLSLVLALMMAVSVAAGSFAAGTTTTAIADTAADYTNAIAFLNAYGIYKGTSADEFNPDATSAIQRFQMALFVARVSTGWVDDSQWVDNMWEDRDANTSVFTDLAGTYAEKVYGAISYANQKGIIEGYGDGKFGPLDGITYQDALTMVVRTLGYKNLPYPWGYIEKAVGLGLTVGIGTGLAYTTVLNRGQVAQIIYNAMFAKTIDGDTLAARNFGGKLGWQTVVITASGKDGDANSKGSVLESGATPTSAGYVQFKVVGADGLPTGDPYTTKVGSFGITTDNHADEKIVGYTYNVLFRKNADNDLAEIIAFEPTYVDTIVNYGRDSKIDGKYPIDAYLGKFNIVSKYNTNDYISGAVNGGYTLSQYIVYNALAGGNAIDSTKVYTYAIDWDMGHILVRDTAGKYVAYYNGEEVKYSVKYYYNQLLQKWFEVETLPVNGGKDGYDVIGIRVVSDDELNKLYDTRYTVTNNSNNGFANGVNIRKTTAYATLKTFAINGSATENYGLYEEYRFGLYTEGKVKCSNGDEKAGIIIKALDTYAEQSWTAAGKAGDYDSYTQFSAVKEGECDHHAAGDVKAWINKTESCADVDSLVSGQYVIYNADKFSGEIKIAKIIQKKDSAKADAKNYWSTGIVRGYDVKNNTVNIDGTTYTYNYTELAGNALNPYSDSVAARAIYTEVFRGFLNNYVRFVIIDGEVVYITLVGSESKNYIVVDSYAGISTDGYIVVNGYKLDDLKYTQFKIGSYDKWLRGDYFNYNAGAGMFRGDLLRITSADKSGDTPIYYVVTSPTRGDAWTIDAINAEGYYKTNGAADWSKMSKSVTYVFAGNPENPVAGTDFAPIYVYTGILPAGMVGFTGTKLDVNDNVKFISYTPTAANLACLASITGTSDQYGVSYVIFKNYNYESAYYDQTYYGATLTTARVIDVCTGDETVVQAANKDLIKGYIYTVINGQIVQDNISVQALTGSFVYTDGFRYIPVNGFSGVFNATYNAVDANGIATSYIARTAQNFTLSMYDKDVMSKYLSTSFGYGAQYKGLIDHVKVYEVTLKNGGTQIDTITELSKDAFKAAYGSADTAVAKAAGDKDTDGFTFNVIAKEGGAAVVYILKAAAKSDIDGTATDKDITGAKIIVGQDSNNKDIEVVGTANVTVDTTVAGKPTNVAINSITLKYYSKDSALINADGAYHQEIGTKGFYFGTPSDCMDLQYASAVTVDGGTPKTIYAPKQTGTKYHADGSTDKNYLKSVTIPVDAKFTGVATGDVHTITVTFKDQDTVDKTTTITFNVTVTATGIDLTYDTGAGKTVTVRDAVLNFVAETKDADGNVLTPNLFK